MEDATGQRGPKRNKKTGGAEMYNKAAGKRWLIIDEISTAALYVSGVMEKNVRKARQGTEFSTDAAGEGRDWGGVNLIVGGDWLQLPPVRAKSIFRNPFLKDCVSVERRILNMFWQLEDVKGIVFLIQQG